MLRYVTLKIKEGEHTFKFSIDITINHLDWHIVLINPAETSKSQPGSDVLFFKYAFPQYHWTEMNNFVFAI